MSDYKEKFEKMRVAGKLAAQTLDMLTLILKKVSQLITLINLGMNL
jgi:methionine aminopeptidase